MTKEEARLVAILAVGLSVRLTRDAGWMAQVVLAICIAAGMAFWLRFADWSR